MQRIFSGSQGLPNIKNYYPLDAVKGKLVILQSIPPRKTTFD